MLIGKENLHQKIPPPIFKYLAAEKLSFFPNQIHKRDDISNDASSIYLSICLSVCLPIFQSINLWLKKPDLTTWQSSRARVSHFLIFVLLAPEIMTNNR